MAVLPHPPPVPGEPSDKILHFVAFLTLGGLGAVAFPDVRLARIVGALAAFGALIEVVQAIPALGRDSEVVDLAFDFAAAVLGGWLARKAWSRFSG